MEENRHQDIKNLASEVVVRQPAGSVPGRLRECSIRAIECLPDAVGNLEKALKDYHWALVGRCRPYSFSGLAYHVGKVFGLISDSRIEDIFHHQSRCFDYMIGLIEDLAQEAGSHESALRSDRDRLADWLVRAESVIMERNRKKDGGGSGTDATSGSSFFRYYALIGEPPKDRKNSLLKSIQEEDARRMARSEELAFNQICVVYHSRLDALPMINRYARVMEGISSSVLTLKAHALAAVEYFTMTFEPAGFIESASDAIPYLERGIKCMAGYNEGLRAGIAECVKRLGNLNDLVNGMRRL